MKVSYVSFKHDYRHQTTFGSCKWGSYIQTHFQLSIAGAFAIAVISKQTGDGTVVNLPTAWQRLKIPLTGNGILYISSSLRRSQMAQKC